MISTSSILELLANFLRNWLGIGGPSWRCHRSSRNCIKVHRPKISHYNRTESNHPPTGTPAKICKACILPQITFCLRGKGARVRQSGRSSALRSTSNCSAKNRNAPNVQCAKAKLKIQHSSLPSLYPRTIIRNTQIKSGNGWYDTRTVGRCSGSISYMQLYCSSIGVPEDLLTTGLLQTKKRSLLGHPWCATLIGLNR